MPDNPHLSETSSEILRYRSNVRYQLSEMLLTFFHTILTWNHDISRSLMIFKHYLLFFYFFRTSLHKLAIKFHDKDASTIRFFRACGISFCWRKNQHTEIWRHCSSSFRMQTKRASQFDHSTDKVKIFLLRPKGTGQSGRFHPGTSSDNNTAE